MCAAIETDARAAALQDLATLMHQLATACLLSVQGPSTYDDRARAGVRGVVVARAVYRNRA
jgi:hypothetical protein